MKALVLHKPTWIDRVGLGAVAASSSRGARTICIDVDDKLELARAAGGAHAINSQRETVHDRWVERILRLTEGQDVLGSFAVISS